MKSPLLAAMTLACVFAAGCDLLNPKSNSSSSTPTAPTPTGPTTSIDAFAGTWQSVTASTPASGCGNVKYTITPVAATSANVTFTATCATNINVSGSGAGTLSGSTINWTATGLVGQGNVNCPFTFSNSTATLGSDGNITVNYSGSVCGIPVSGSETVKK